MLSPIFSIVFPHTKKTFNLSPFESEIVVVYVLSVSILIVSSPSGLVGLLGPSLSVLMMIITELAPNEKESLNNQCMGS